MPKQAIKTLRATAYHEAGHAVAGWYLECGRAGKITIVPDTEAGTLGTCEVYIPKWVNPEVNSNARTQKWVEDRIVGLFAGAEAERMFSGRYNHIGAEQDRSVAVNLASYVCSEEETGAFLEWLTIRARVFVNQKRPFIEAVADALIEHSTLQRAQFIETLKNAADALCPLPQFSIVSADGPRNRP